MICEVDIVVWRMWEGGECVLKQERVEVLKWGLSCLEDVDCLTKIGLVRRDDR